MLHRLIERLNELQIRRPWVTLAVVGVITIFFGWRASKLELRTRYDALLPESQPSVQELRRVESRTASAQTVLILLEGKDRKALRAMGDAIVPALLALGPDVISSAEDGVQEARSFLAPRAGLFLSRKDLLHLQSDVEARWDYEVAKEQGMLLDDHGPPVTADDIERRLRKRAAERASGGGDDDADDDDAKTNDTSSGDAKSGDAKAGDAKSGDAKKDDAKKDDKDDAKAGSDERYPDGYYERKDGTALVVQARSGIPGGDLARTGPALDKVRAAVDAVKASRPEFAQIQVGYAGDMPQGFVEYDRIRSDLLTVGASGIGLVLSVVLIYFMRLRALFVMGVTIAVGLTWTFGVTQMAIGYLTVATGFLASIVAGNGINVGILYQSRYYEERRRGVPSIEALRRSVFATWQPTVIAALAAAASYVSLLVTDFSAFRQFGFIAATGMLFCWIVKTLMVPPMLLLLERRRPIDETPAAAGKGIVARLRSFGLGYGRIFAWIVPKAPAVLFGAGVLITIAGLVAGVRYVRRDPMDYDLGSIENDPDQTSSIHHVWDGVIEILGAGHGGMVVLADTPEDAKALEHKLKAEWNAAPKNDKPFAGIHTLWSLVPDDQAEKIPILLDIGDRLERARARGFIPDKEWDKVKDAIPPHDLRPYGIADLPETLARPFSEKDGTRGRLVVIEPEPSASNDLRYLLKYSDSFRETRLPNGKVIRGSGRVVIFADILKEVVHDIPKAVALSLGLTILAVIVTFGSGGWYALTVLFALLLGVSGELLFLYYANIKINFLNFAALPITFGIGVDYAVNVVQRYRADGGRDILAALRTTGGAVVLCSLTTMVSYLALVGSLNRAIRSLGVIAAVGEASCLLAAVTVLPAGWLLVERWRRAHGREPPAPEGRGVGGEIVDAGEGHEAAGEPAQK